MWGQHIESELDKVRAASKDSKTIDTKLKNKLMSILHPIVEQPEDGQAPASVPKGRFRDPMQFIGKQGKG